jgi:hypothetical protein
MPRSFSRGLKPADLADLIGTDKSVPFQNILRIEFFSTLLKAPAPSGKTNPWTFGWLRPAPSGKNKNAVTYLATTLLKLGA